MDAHFTRKLWVILYIFFFICVADDEFGEKTVSILLDGEESEMVFIDHPSSEMSVSNKELYYVYLFICAVIIIVEAIS